jgi:7-cyano-7-deazaguanine synthase
MKTSICLISGGLDSIVSTTIAIKKTKVILGITFDYGQKSNEKEITSAKEVCKYFSIPHKVIKIEWMKNSKSALLYDSNMHIPEFYFNKGTHCNTSKDVWVSNRNGIFINIAAYFAEELECDIIVVGFNKEEAETFPDNSIKFLRYMNKTLSYSTLNRVKVISFTQSMNKSEIVRTGIINNAPLQYIWSCYKNQQLMCGVCESCKRCIRAFKLAGYFNIISDRFLYDKI